ncbi:MAG: hypothetical protein ACP5H3_02190 [Candidatus Aenigmatarchaeota archaeon]
MLLQASLEFFALVSLLIVILLTVMYYNSSYYLQFYNLQIYEDARKISESVATEINLALKAGDGYSRIFQIPEKILNSIDYNVSISNYRVKVFWNSGETQSVIYTKEIFGYLKKGDNWIRNVNGEIYVN